MFYKFRRVANIPGMLRQPTQYPAVPATTLAPLPVACTSLMRPPVPVVAPWKGATPGVVEVKEFEVLLKGFVRVSSGCWIN